jgi:3-oxoacyl-[acyl-carrier protein] reductase
MELDLKGRTAFVSGASTGIGAGIARALAREGVRTAISARRASRLEHLADEIAGMGWPRPVVAPGDVTVPCEVANTAAFAHRELGSVDILVNCAGGSRPLTRGDDDAIWNEAFSLNFSAARRLSEAVLPGMRARRWGRIINISGSMEPRSVNAASAAKAALHIWAKGLSCETAAEGITINTIQPGRINSEQILEKLYPTEESRRAFISQHVPIGYFGEPEDIGMLVAFLASPVARYMTGAVIPVDGGMHFFAH